MTFCTACASPIATPNQSCPTCGALHTPAVALHGSPFLRDAPAKQSILIRLLYLAPVLLLFAVAVGLVQRHAAQEQWLESAYAAAQDAARSGDMVAAREGFMAIVGYRDAAEQAHDIDTASNRWRRPTWTESKPSKVGTTRPPSICWLRWPSRHPGFEIP